MRRFFRQKRREDPDAPDHLVPESEGIVLPEMVPELSSGFNGPTARVEPTHGTTVVADRPVEEEEEEEEEERDKDRIEGVEHHDNRGAESLVDIVDADGNVIGPAEQIEPWNQWVEGIQELEIRRPVKIRRGRRFNTTHLAGIYERTEAKGVKWLSCMIQATGAIQAKRCLSCDKNQGAFDDSIIPPSSKPALQFPQLQPERQPDIQIERQPEWQYEQQPEQQPERPVEPQPAAQTERQSAWTTAPQPERSPERQPQKVPDQPNERFHDVLAAKAPERTVEVAPIQIAEHPREMAYRSVHGPPHGPSSRPTPIHPHPRPLETPRSVLPSGVLRRSPHEILHPSPELNGHARGYRGSDPAQT
ncbi:hypothetical protein Forpe1208_v012008 [Fusarium oxysporum f. sp. rapae]|uniref:Uncharacterized protein n=1 Tax=Fusarium oxysporum f. sp. rapae TaxID=485398 RepID=A0A8J5NPK3_FUSOX|nr:hypothetical protein Forpe1208_v012008 [Fusarium oxysporum f. sp. rapae]